MRPGRVLVACADPGIPLYGPSGASAHTRGVARAFAALGWQVRVATARAEDHRGRWDAPLGLPAFHAAPRDLVRTALTGGFEPDLVWERHTLAGGAPVDAPRFVELNAPLVRERHWIDGVRERRLATWREAASLRRATRVIAVSRWLADWATGLGCADVRHVPNGVEPRPVPPGPRGTRVVGFLGTCKPWHGIDRFPALLDALGPGWTGLCVGDGPCPPPPHPRLVHVGRVEPAEVPAHLARMSVGIAPYRTSAPPWFCPLKVLEYRAVGLPVVATDLGDCRALVDGGGEVVATDDPSAWAAAIERQAASRPAVATRTWTDVLEEALS